MNKCMIIAISGGSGSGKTTLAELLQKRFGEEVTLISQDSYYRDLSHLSDAKRNKTNFDHPDSLDCELLKKNVHALRDGSYADAPVYCFKTHTRKNITEKLEPKRYIIVEGIYSYYEKGLHELADYTIYVDASDDIRLIRRIRRDVVERGRDVESVISQYESTVRKMHNEFIDKQKCIADIIIENNGDIDLHSIVDALVHNINNICDKQR